MVNVAVVGAGIAGLGVALALARRRHTVSLYEADPAPVPDDAAAMWSEWPRPVHRRLACSTPSTAGSVQCFETELSMYPPPCWPLGVLTAVWSCTSLCTAWNEEDQDNTSCREAHVCWCPDGSLSRAEWERRHPRRAKWQEWENE